VIDRVGEHRPESVERPGQPAGPVGVAREALVRGLAEELAGIQVEDPLVRGAAVGADQRPLRSPAVRGRACVGARSPTGPSARLRLRRREVHASGNP
jgi:hypothetical protein